MNKMRKYLLLAVLAGLGLRLFFVLHFPMTDAGDTALYAQLGQNWTHHHVYGIWVDGQLVPVNLRVPGYPAFLAAISAVFGASRLAIMFVQAVIDLATCFLTAALAARLAPAHARGRVATAAMWLAATCPFLANYSAVLLTEILATFLTALALVVFLSCPDTELLLRDWFVGGLVVGVATLVRPETPLLLAALALVLGFRWRRPADWGKLARTGALLAAGLLAPLLPWGARNWRTFHEVQFLAPRYAQLPGEIIPRGFYAWTNTWLVRFRDVYLVPWKLDEEPIRIEDLPSTAFDSAEERARVAALLEQYNKTLTLSPEVDDAFGEIARERTARHPWRTYLKIPLERAAVLWFTPRVELLPYSGHLWPPGQLWREDPVDFCVTAGFGLLGLLYAGLALVGAWRWRRRPGLALLVVFIPVRTAFFARVETPEPRYVLECFPAVLALAALAWAKPSPTPAQHKRNPTSQNARGAHQEPAA